jgi:hypothetical protein
VATHSNQKVIKGYTGFRSARIDPGHLKNAESKPLIDLFEISQIKFAYSAFKDVDRVERESEVLKSPHMKKRVLVRIKVRI